MNVPDYISPIVGHRFWHWDGVRLLSLNGEPWLPCQVLKASCKAGSRSGKPLPVDGHQAPQNGLHMRRLCNQRTTDSLAAPSGTTPKARPGSFPNFGRGLFVGNHRGTQVRVARAVCVPEESYVAVGHDSMWHKRIEGDVGCTRRLWCRNQLRR